MQRKRTNNQQSISKIFKPVSKTSKNNSNELNEHLLSIFNPNLKKKQNEVEWSGAKIKLRTFQRDEDKFLDFLNHDCYWNHGAIDSVN